jgi:hypothetical protein
MQEFKFQTPRPPPVTNPGTPVAPHPLDKLGGLSGLRQLVRVCVCVHFSGYSGFRLRCLCRATCPGSAELVATPPRGAPPHGREGSTQSMSLARYMLAQMNCRSLSEVLVMQSLRRCQLDASGVRLVAQLLPQLEVRTMGCAMDRCIPALRWDLHCDHTQQPPHGCGFGWDARIWVFRSQVGLKHGRATGALLYLEHMQTLLCPAVRSWTWAGTSGWSGMDSPRPPRPWTPGNHMLRSVACTPEIGMSSCMCQLPMLHQQKYCRGTAG